MRVAAVCSRSAASGEAFRERAGAAKVHTAFGDLLADPEIDAVYVATPNSLHAEQAFAALQAGKPVLVEKPLATTTSEAEAMIARAAESGVLLMEGMWTRFLPAIEAARKMLAEGAIGTVVRVRGELAYFHTEIPESRLFDPALGGGAALDLGVYLLSLAINLFGRPEGIGGRWRAAKSGVDLSTDFLLRLANGVEATLSCGFDREGDNAFTIIGTEGAVRLRPPFLKAQQLTLFSAPLRGFASIGGWAGKVMARLPVPGAERRIYGFPGGGLQFEADAFARSVQRQERQNDVMPLEDSMAVLKIIETVKSRLPEKTR